MLKIGLTGGICSGKSFVINCVSSYEYVVTLSADESAGFVCQRGEEGYASIVDMFGEDVLADDGEIDRSKLASIVFEDRQKLSELEKIVHPLVKQNLEQQMVDIDADDVVVIEVPLLYEAHFEDMVDKVIVVACTEDEQIARCLQRDGLSEEAVRQRMIRQMPLRDKVVKANFVIDNNLNMDETRRQIESLWPKIIKKK